MPKPGLLQNLWNQTPAVRKFNHYNQLLHQGDNHSPNVTPTPIPGIPTTDSPAYDRYIQIGDQWYGVNGQGQAIAVTPAEVQGVDPSQIIHPSPTPSPSPASTPNYLHPELPPDQGTYAGPSAVPEPGYHPGGGGSGLNYGGGSDLNYGSPEDWSPGVTMSDFNNASSPFEFGIGYGQGPTDWGAGNWGTDYNTPSDPFSFGGIGYGQGPTDYGNGNWGTTPGGTDLNYGNGSDLNYGGAGDLNYGSPSDWGGEPTVDVGQNQDPNSPGNTWSPSGEIPNDDGGAGGGFGDEGGLSGADPSDPTAPNTTTPPDTTPSSTYTPPHPSPSDTINGAPVVTPIMTQYGMTLPGSGSSGGNYFSGYAQTNNLGQAIGYGMGGPTQNWAGGQSGLGMVQPGTNYNAALAAGGNIAQAATNQKANAAAHEGAAETSGVSSLLTPEDYGEARGRENAIVHPPSVSGGNKGQSGSGGHPLLHYSTGGAVSPISGQHLHHRIGDSLNTVLDPDEVVFTPEQLEGLRIADRSKLRADQISAIFRSRRKAA